MNEIRTSAAIRRKVLRGILFMCLAITIMPMMNAIAKYLVADYPLPQVVWARFTGHFLFMIAIFWPRFGWRLFATTRPAMQFGRSAVMFTSNGLFIVALATISLPTSSAIMFTAPLMVTALSVPFLNEQVGPRRWAAVILGFMGALLIIRPGLGGMQFGAVLTFGSAALFAVYQIMTRKIGDDDPAETSIVYMALIAAIAMSIAMPFYFEPPKVPLHWFLFGIVGCLGGVTQFFVIKALQIAPASTVAPYLYGELIGATLLGFAIFGDFPDPWTWTGAGIIVASGVYVAYREGLAR
jgi:drug/metabolite transporter (DMT)-like permease